ncbi:MAG: GAF domain-containing protein [Symploca sp. SIO1B1]|nr:GAF domain-containing protein [Symploca sp. SIO1B1]
MPSSKPSSSLQKNQDEISQSSDTRDEENHNANGTASSEQQADQSDPKLDWLQHCHRYSQLLMALVEPNTFKVQYANDYFCQLTGLTTKETSLAEQEIRLTDLLVNFQTKAIESLYRQHLLLLILRDIYHLEVQGKRLLEQPVIVSVKSPLYPEPRLIEFTFRSQQLKVTRRQSQDHEFADWDVEQLLVEHDSVKLINLSQLPIWTKQLRLEDYQLSGNLLVEGSDVTERETIGQLIELLIEQKSMLQADKFFQINQHLRSLFRATNTLVLQAEDELMRLFIPPEPPDTSPLELKSTAYSRDSLSSSHFLQAADSNQVRNIPDLSQDCPTDCERSLAVKGVRSLLLIPLVVKDTNSSNETGQLAGVVGIMSDHPHHFDELDCQHARELMPAFTAGLRQAIQRHFSHIHPAVEWRFMQEAERRSWGLPAEPIIFTDVYPLYGISDIRGSSNERNKAIQTDLLVQFNLALTIVEAVEKHQGSAFCQQLRLDLLDYIEKLKIGVKVEAEVTAQKILREQLEVYLDHFATCGAEAQKAVEDYRQSCNNSQGSVYVARDQYDKKIGQINSLLKETWERWQVRMQQIIPHYCDIECTDGLDHMIYVGESIDSEFSLYHLRSLRYEQLRAICDCARTIFNRKNPESNQLTVTHLVLVQDFTIDISHDESTEKLFDVRGTKDIRYEIVKKRIDKAMDKQTHTRITQPGMLTVVYSTQDEWREYQQYLHYLAREGWVDSKIISGTIEPLQGITGLKFARVEILMGTRQEAGGRRQEADGRRQE